MIVDLGKVELQNAQLTVLSSYWFGLFTNNWTVSSGTILSDLTEAGWTGYSRQSGGSWTSAMLVGPMAQSRAGTLPIFSNTSGGSVTFYGWFMVTLSSGGILVAAENIGSTTIPDGDVYVLAPAITDTQE